MKTVADYIQTLVEDATAVNTTGPEIATKDVPLGGVQKRKQPTEESFKDEAAEGEAPPGEPAKDRYSDRVGTDPLAQVYAPDIDTGTDNGHMFHQKQASQQNYS
jgi:hypothetical protein